MKHTNLHALKSLFAEINTFLSSKWFLISIIIVTVLCYTTPIYYGDGISELSVLELLRLKSSRSFGVDKMQYQISVILPRVVQGYLAIFVPVISALPFVVFQQAEKSGRYQRFYMFRSVSSRCYYIRKWLSGIVTGGLVLLFGIAFFQMTFVILDGSLSGKWCVGKSVEHLFYLRYYAGIFLYGAVSTIPAMLISFLSCNLYFIVCIPFIVVFMYNLLVSYLYRFVDSSPIPHLTRWLDNLYSYGFQYAFDDVFSFVQITFEIIALIIISIGIVSLRNRRRLDLTD